MSLWRSGLVALALVVATPTFAQDRQAILLRGYTDAVRECLSTRAKGDVALGMRDRHAIAREAAQRCLKGFQDAMVVNGIMTPDEAARRVSGWADRAAVFALATR